MKLTYLPLLFALILAVKADVSWYVGGSRNITCTGHDDGHISCEPGHEAGAPEVLFTYSYTQSSTITLPIALLFFNLNIPEGFPRCLISAKTS